MMFHKNKTLLCTYACDGGCLKLAVDGAVIKFINTIGDGEHDVYIAEENYRESAEFDFIAVLEVREKLEIFSYDICDDVEMILQPAEYILYSGRRDTDKAGAFLFVKGELPQAGSPFVRCDVEAIVIRGTLDDKFSLQLLKDSSVE